MRLNHILTYKIFINFHSFLKNMEIKIINESKQTLEFELKGEDHSFCNLLKDFLNKVEGVTAASYRIDHPLVGVPRIFVETNTKTTPRKALEKAIALIQKENDTFKKELAKVK